MTDPYELLDGIEERVNAMQQQAIAMRDEMAAVSVTEQSRDGQIQVTVNSAGNLTDLQIGPSARADPTLAQDIMRTVQLAQSKLADAVRSAVPSAQATPETLSAVVSQMHEMFPEPEPDDYVKGGYAEGPAGGVRFLPDDPHSPVSPPSPPARSARPMRPDATPDDDYYSAGGFLRQPGQEGDR